MSKPSTLVRTVGGLKKIFKWAALAVGVATALMLAHHKTLKDSAQKETITLEELKEFPQDSTLMVVFTGGQGRIDSTLSWATQAGIKNVLISGCNPKEKDSGRHACIQKNNPHLNLIFSYDPQSTIENVVDAALCAKKLDLQNIVITTSDYHLARSHQITQNMDDVFREGTKISHMTLSNESLSFFDRAKELEFLKTTYMGTLGHLRIGNYPSYPNARNRFDELSQHGTEQRQYIPPHNASLAF